MSVMVSQVTLAGTNIITDTSYTGTLTDHLVTTCMQTVGATMYVWAVALYQNAAF